MPNTSLHDTLQAFVREDEPPMGLTVAEVLKAGRRSRRHRRASAVAAVALVALVGVAAVPRLLPMGLHSSTFGALAWCPSPGPRPTDKVDPARAFSPAMATWAAGSLTCALADELPRLLPDAQFAREPGAPAGPLVGYTLGGAPPFGNRVDAMALVRDRHGTGDLYISVGVPTIEDQQGEIASCPQSLPCEVRNVAAGVTALVSEQIPAVTVFRGHSEIHIQASDTNRQSVNGGPPVATRDAPVLTAEQILDLALSPQLDLFP